MVLTSHLTSQMFQFTHPGRGATSVDSVPSKRTEFQFTHPGRGATSGQSVQEHH